MDYLQESVLHFLLILDDIFHSNSKGINL